jgi:hypothetical protein
LPSSEWLIPVLPRPGCRRLKPKGQALNNIILDALDAIELAEILEYFMERLDILAEHDLTKLLFADCSTYNLDDLRTDVARLINRLYTSPYAS